MHGSTPLTGRRSPAARRRVSLAAVLLLLLSALAPLAGARAQDAKEGQLLPIGQFQALQPIQDQISGSVWTMLQGYGPAGRQIPTDPEAQAAFNWTGPGMAASGGARGNSGASYQQVPARNPAPAFSRNLILTRQEGYAPYATEPNVAVDPNDPDHVVVGVIDYNSPTALATYVSFDGGETWAGPNQIRFFREDYGGAGDPVVAFDRTGAVYLSFISIGIEEFYLGSIASYSEVSSMAVTKSSDGGLTWSDPVSAARGIITTVSNVDQAGKERGTVTFPFFDKEWIAIGPDPADPAKDILYLSFTDFETTYGLLYSDEVPYLSAPATETTIRLVSSRDGGVTWSAPTAVSPTVLEALTASAPGQGEAERGAPAGGLTGAGDAGTGSADDTGGAGQTEQAQVDEQEGTGVISASRTVQGSQPVVTADGTVVVAYLDSTDDGAQEGLFTIQVATSKDAGKTFSEPKTAAILREPHFQPRNSQFRYWGTAFPQLAVGPNQEIYVATTALPADKPTDDGDIYLLRSLDGGATWKQPLRLNTDNTSRLQMFPSIDVSPDGTLHAMWADMRDDPREVRYNIYYSKSEDQGATWGFTLPDQSFTAPDTRVSDFASNPLKGFPGGAFIGDYFSLAATNGEVYMVWPDTRLGEFGGYNQQIAFARSTAIQQPELYLNPPSGSAGRVVQIQGFGFQPQSNIQLLVSGVITANPRTDDQGQFQASIYMPLTGEGPTSISAFDETGNFASASFYTEFGFDTLQRSLDAIEGALQSGTAFPPASTAPGPTGGTPAAASPVAVASTTPISTSLFPAGSPAATPRPASPTAASPVASPSKTPLSTSLFPSGSPTATPTPSS